MSSSNRITDEEYYSAISIIMNYREQCRNDIDGIDDILKDGNKLSNTLITDTDISVRLHRVLKSFWIGYSKIPFEKARVKNLDNFPFESFSKCREVGKKSLEELKWLCCEADIKMNMTRHYQTY